MSSTTTPYSNLVIDACIIKYREKRARSCANTLGFEVWKMSSNKGHHKEKLYHLTGDNIVDSGKLNLGELESTIFRLNIPPKDFAERAILAYMASYRRLFGILPEPWHFGSCYLAHNNTRSLRPTVVVYYRRKPRAVYEWSGRRLVRQNFTEELRTALEKAPHTFWDDASSNEAKAA